MTGKRRYTKAQVRILELRQHCARNGHDIQQYDDYYCNHCDVVIIFEYPGLPADDGDFDAATSP